MCVCVYLLVGILGDLQRRAVSGYRIHINFRGPPESSKDLWGWLFYVQEALEGFHFGLGFLYIYCL